jgi:selenocysteine-specific elongation factor
MRGVRGATAGETRGVILGTAGHIDHGKTTLIRALTGVDTDRLKEEKERGITIELGFAELARGQGARFGVVDVPGHEAFVRAMVAGAAGMDVVLLVVAADEGVMPQTREHLAIVELLGIEQLVVALTKCDGVDPEWLELVHADVAELLETTPYRGAPRVETSAVTGAGLDELTAELFRAAERVHPADPDDLARLPLDRVFTIQGTGTVVTGTLWTGTIESGARVRILPGDQDARVRALQVHGRDVATAHAGDRVAAGLAGPGVDRESVLRGNTVVTHGAWRPTWMLTARVRLLPDTEWSLEHNQRVHVHLGTSEVLARCALLEGAPLRAGQAGWVQLRLEVPLLARARDRFVIRAYSPVTTIGGGRVAECLPPKRNRLDAAEEGALDAVLDGSDHDAVHAYLRLTGWSGAALDELPIHVGLSPDRVGAALATLEAEALLRTSERAFSAQIRDEAEGLLLSEVSKRHAADPIRPHVPLSALRTAIPAWAPKDLADAVVEKLVGAGRLELHEGGVRSPGHEPFLTSAQEDAMARLQALLLEGGLAPPFIEELPAELRDRPDFWSLVQRLEGLGVVRQVADGLYVACGHLEEGAHRVREALGGRSRLGPADFRDPLPVTRKHLIPLLNYYDGVGTTVRSGEGRSVPLNG